MFWWQREIKSPLYTYRLTQELGQGAFGKILLAKAVPVNGGTTLEVVIKEPLNQDEITERCLQAEINAFKVLSLVPDPIPRVPRFIEQIPVPG